MTTQLFDHADDRIAVDVWSDVMCPFCYLGDGLLGKALEDFRRPIRWTFAITASC